MVGLEKHGNARNCFAFDGEFNQSAKIVSKSVMFPKFPKIILTLTEITF